MLTKHHSQLIFLIEYWINIKVIWRSSYFIIKLDILNFSNRKSLSIQNNGNSCCVMKETMLPIVCQLIDTLFLEKAGGEPSTERHSCRTCVHINIKLKYLYWTDNVLFLSDGILGVAVNYFNVECRMRSKCTWIKGKMGQSMGLSINRNKFFHQGMEIITFTSQKNRDNNALSRLVILNLIFHWFIHLAIEWRNRKALWLTIND